MSGWFKRLIRGAPKTSAPDFNERVRQRAHLLWEQAGRPHGLADAHWQRALELETATDEAMPTTIERLQFESDLAEVQLLLDFISGRSDKAFAWKREPAATSASTPPAPTADASAVALAQAVANDRITLEELQQVATIRFPPNKTFEANAADAALLIAVRDKLNQLIRPASGLTVAFTLCVWAPIAVTSSRLNRDWARWKLANLAYPRLGAAVTRFRVSAFAISMAAVVMTLVTVGLSNEVADGTAKLNRIQSLDQKRLAMIDLIRQFEGLEAAANLSSQADPTPPVPPTGQAAARHAFVVRYCEKEQLIPPRIMQTGGTVPQFESAQQYETCDAFGLLAAQLSEAQSDLQDWWSNWERSPYVAAVCGLRRIGGSPPTDCQPGRGRDERATQIAAVGAAFPVGAAGDTPNGASHASTFRQPLATDTLTALTTIWLPMLYGLLGAIVAALRSIYGKISNSTLAPWDTRLMWTRVMLGLMAGACIGLFFSPSGGSAPGAAGIGTLSLSALAFLAGYAVDGLFAMLDEIIRRVFRLEPETPQPIR